MGFSSASEVRVPRGRRIALVMGLTAILMAAQQAVLPSAEAGSRGKPPRAGTCWAASEQEVNALTYSGSVRVPCASLHAVETVGKVKKIPRSVAKRGYGSRQVISYMAERCRAKINTYTGIGPSERRYTSSKAQFYGYSEAWLAIYIPTVKQWRHGARWGSCAVISGSPEGPQPGWLVLRRGSVKGAGGAGRLSPAVSTSSGGSQIRMISVRVSTSRDEVYPGEQVVTRRAAAACSRLLGAALSGNSWPSPDTWAAGGDRAVCNVAASGY